MPLEAQRHGALYTSEGLSYDVHDEMSFEVFQQVMRNPGASIGSFFQEVWKAEYHSSCWSIMIYRILLQLFGSEETHQPKQVCVRLSMLSKFAHTLTLTVVAAVSG